MKSTFSGRMKYIGGAFVISVFGVCQPSATAQDATHVEHGVPVRTITQAPDSNTLAFVQKARAATSRFKDIDVAISAGYRRIGPDMPNMGEHWINIRTVISREAFDPGRPGVLTYLLIDAKRELTGVAYTAVVRDAGSLPEVPVAGATWHFHDRTVTEEAIGHSMDSDADTGSPRLAMLHAWLFADNPAGMFTADNWALPYYRLGLEIPQTNDSDAARALHLVSGGVEFYVSIADQLDDLDTSELDLVREYLDAGRQEVEQLLETTRTSLPAPRFAEVWRQIWADLASKLGPERQELLLKLSGR